MYGYVFMSKLSLSEITEKMLKLEDELAVLRGNKFEKFFKLNIKKKECKLAELMNTRSLLISESNFLSNLKSEKIVLLLGSKLAQRKDLIYITSLMRESMAKNWGYLVPSIRIVDNFKLADDEFEIKLRGGAVSEIFKLDGNLRREDVSNYVVATLQTFLFDNASTVLSLHDMNIYISAIKANETEVGQNSSFWESVNWLIWDLKSFLCELLQERYSIKNISFVADKFLEFYYLKKKSLDYSISALKSILPMYPEKLFVYDWVINRVN